MNTLESPFFLRSIADPSSRELLAQRVAQRMAYHSDSGSFRSFGSWCEWFERLTGHRDVDTVLSFISAVDARSLALDVYSPHVILRSQSGGAGVRSLARHLNAASGPDQDYILDHIRNYHGSVDTCESCGDWFALDDMETTYSDGYVCEGCRDDHYRWSEFHDQWIHEDNATTAIGRRGREIVIHEDTEGFHYDEDRGCLVSDEYEPPEPPSIIRQYHSSKPYFAARPDEWTARHDRFLGVELEVECGSRDPGEVADAIHQRVNGGEFGRSIFFENDGSLTNGFEMISQPMSLPALREVFGFLRSSELLSGVRSHRTTTCGLHVHVGRSGLSNVTIARAVTFVNDPQNDAFVTALARRYNTSYCKVAEKDIELAHLPGDRYEAINLTGRATIEFRIFRGSLKYEAVVAAVEFCHAILEFCGRPETSATALNARAFLAFCASQLEEETRTLRAYVDQRTAGIFRHSEAA